MAVCIYLALMFMAAAAAMMACSLHAAAKPADQFIRVAKDKFNFEDGQHRRFIPFGAFYADERHTEIDPLSYWKHYDKSHIKSDFQLAKSLGCNTLRVVWTASVTQLPSGKRTVLTKDDLAKMDHMLDATRRNGLHLYVAPKVEGSTPQITQDRELWLSSLQTIGQRYKNNPWVLCWELDSEPTTLVGYPGDKEIWLKWLIANYHSDAAIAKAWNADPTTPAWKDVVWQNLTSIIQHSGDFDAKRNVKPELWYLDQYNISGSQMVLDWQLFRNDLYTHKISILANALRNADPNHMLTLDFTLYSFPLVRNPAAPGWGGIYGYSGNDIPALSKLVDFFGVHAYPFYVPPFSTEWAEQLTRNDTIFQRELRFLETYIRYFKVNSGKPIVLSENGWHGGEGDWQHNTEQDQARWNTALITETQDCAVGWLNWTLRDIPTHDQAITAHSGLVRAAIALKPDTNNQNPLSDYLYAGDLPINQQSSVKPWGVAFGRIVSEAYRKPAQKFVKGKRFIVSKSQAYTGTSREVDALLKQCLKNERCDVVVK